MRKIGTRLAVQIFCVILVVMALFGMLAVRQQRIKLTDWLQAKEDRTLRQLSLVLGTPIWNMSKGEVDTILLPYLDDTDILSIRVMETAGPMSYMSKDPATLDIQELPPDSETAPNYVDAFHRKIDILYNGEGVGTVEIVFSRRSIDAQVNETVAGTGIAMAALILGEAIVLFVLVRRNISQPLNKIVQVARQVAEGDVYVRLDRVRSQDEIGMLTATFQDIIGYLQNMAEIADAIKHGDLNHTITPKSDRDVLGHALHGMAEYLTEMAGIATAVADGDLRLDVQPKTDHDILGKAFQRMRALRQTMSNIMLGAGQLGDASATLQDISAEMASHSEQSSVQLQSVSSNTQAISDNMTNISTSTEQLAANIREISNNMNNVSQVMTSAVNVANNAHEAIATLERHSQEIGEIIQVITSITQQTNLLALNATIEAARAGDVGKGFAVVANEIKELSRETAESADDIIRKVEAIQTSTAEATSAIAEVTGITHKVHELSTSTTAAVEQQSATTNEISQTITSLAFGSEKMTGIIADVTDTSQETSEQTVHLQEAAQELAELAQQLRKHVELFKI